MVEKRTEKKNIFLYGLGVLILALGFSVLVYLERRVVSDRKATVENAKALLGRERLLKAPDDIRISFSSVESLARSLMKNPFIKQIMIAKIVSGEEVIIYPFYHAALSGEKQTSYKRWKKEPLVENEKLLGYLYIDLNNRIITGVRLAAASFAILLFLTLISYYIRVHTQEQVISKTSVELEEKTREMIRLERLALAGQLTANILHDIKKPVLNIKEEARDFREGASPEENRSMAQNILDQVDLFFQILRELSLERFVKAREDREEYVDINEMLDRSCALVRYEQGSVLVNKEYEKDISLVFAHPYKLIQLFSNLILNAYQAMEGKGTLVLKTRALKKEIQAEISDTGPGIAPEDTSRLFTPFFTTRGKSAGGEEGTGLGLYISKNIVDELSGKIKVNSAPGRGTTFIINLPVKEKKQAE